jgi:hypothetical protein
LFIRTVFDSDMLQIADGLKNALINAKFTTIESILNSDSSEIASILGIDNYVAKIIFDAAEKAGNQKSFVQQNNV